MKYLLILLFSAVFFSSFIHKVKAYAPSVYISEILPDADGADAGKEWLEIYNNLTEPLNIKDYYFINRSLTGTERKVIINSSVNVPAKQYYLISEGAQNIPSENILIVGSGKINMFNDESDLELYDSDGVMIDRVHYLKPIEAKSLERKGPEDILDCNKLVSNPTGSTILSDNLARDPICFGQVPVSAPITPPQDKCLSIGLISSNLADTAICTRGFITAEPDILGDKIFYIEDGGVGFKIKLKTTPSVVFKLGDRVEVTGLLKSIKDGLYLYADSLTLLTNISNVYPTLLNDLPSQKYSLVEFTGEIVKNYSKSMDLEFGNSTIRVSVLASTGIEMPTRTVGDKLRVTGILVEEAGIFKILPRYQEDLSVLEKEEVVAKAATLSQTKTQKEVTSTIISKPKPEVVISKVPDLTIKRIEVGHVKLVKYSIGRGWFLLFILIAFLLLSLLIFRKKIVEFLKKIKMIEIINTQTEIIDVKRLDFERDKYELMFGNTS